jgi:hypothetical protein
MNSSQSGAATLLLVLIIPPLLGADAAFPLNIPPCPGIVGTPPNNNVETQNGRIVYNRSYQNIPKGSYSGETYTVKRDVKQRVAAFYGICFTGVATFRNILITAVVHNSAVVPTMPGQGGMLSGNAASAPSSGGMISTNNNVETQNGSYL